MNIGANQLQEDLIQHGFYYVAKRSGVVDEAIDGASRLKFLYFRGHSVIGTCLRDEPSHELITVGRLDKLSALFAKKYGLPRLGISCEMKYTLAANYGD